MAIAKQIKIQNPSGTGYDSRDIGAEAQYVEVSRDSSGEIIEDITATGVTVDSTEDLSITLKNLEDNKQDNLTFDSAPTQGSTNPVTSNGIYIALQDIKQDMEPDSEMSASSTNSVQNRVITAALNKKIDTYTESPGSWDTTPTQDSTKPITSGGVYATVTDLQAAFQAGVDAVYNAVVAENVIPSASTPTAIAQAIATIRDGGNATEAQILKDQTAYSGKVLRTGTMENRGSWSPTLTPTGNNTATTSIPAGYYSGGTITANGATSYSAGRTQGRADKKSNSGFVYVYMRYIGGGGDFAVTFYNSAGTDIGDVVFYPGGPGAYRYINANSSYTYGVSDITVSSGY